MAWRFKASKYKNAAPIVPKPEACIRDICVGSYQTYGNNICASAAFMAFNWEHVGSSMAVLPLDDCGRKSKTMPLLHAHSDTITDMEFSPFHDGLLMTGSQDSLVKIWHIPREGLKESLSTPECTLSHKQRRVENVGFHPVADGLIHVASGHELALWDLTQQKEAFVNRDHSEVIQSTSWKRDGKLLVTSCKDKKVRIIDPRTSEPVLAVANSHQNIKDSRVVWLGDQDKILTTGFDSARLRQIMIRDVRNLSQTQKTLELDCSTGVLMPLYDPDTNMLFLAGKGDTTILYMELTDREPYLIEGLRHSGEQTKGACLVPKRALRVMEGEVNRVLQLTGTTVVPVMYQVPRKSYREYHADLYPPTRGPHTPLNAPQWLAKSDAQPPTISLQPGQHNVQQVHRGNLEELVKTIQAMPAPTNKTEKIKTPTKIETPKPIVKSVTPTKEDEDRIDFVNVKDLIKGMERQKTKENLKSVDTKETNGFHKKIINNSENGEKTPEHENIEIICEKAPKIIEAYEKEKCVEKLGSIEKSDSKTEKICENNHKKVNEKVDILNEKADKVNEKTEKVDKVNEKVEKINVKVDKVNEKVDKVNEKVDKLNERVDKTDEMTEKTDNVPLSLSRSNSQINGVQVPKPLPRSSISDGGSLDETPEAPKPKPRTTAVPISGYKPRLGPKPFSTSAGSEEFSFDKVFAVPSVPGITSHTASSPLSSTPLASTPVAKEPEDKDKSLSPTSDLEHTPQKEEINGKSESSVDEPTNDSGCVLTPPANERKNIETTDGNQSSVINQSIADRRRAYELRSVSSAVECETPSSPLALRRRDSLKTRASVDRDEKRASVPNVTTKRTSTVFGKVSKFRHLKGTPGHKSTHVENIKNVSRQISGECNGFYANAIRCALPVSGGGGRVAVVELPQGATPLASARPTHPAGVHPPALLHPAPLQDWTWDPFRDDRLMVACDDGMVREWIIPEGGLQESSNTPNRTFSAHPDKIYIIRFHPTASDLLTTAAHDLTVKIWDLSRDEPTPAVTLTGHTDQIFAMDWSPYGDLLATVCKDGLIRIYSPRTSNEPIRSGPGPSGSRGARLTWAINDSHLVVTGFDKVSERQIVLYKASDLSAPLCTVGLDVSPAILQTYIDHDSGTLFLTGRGDSTIYCYEVTSEPPYLCALSHHRSATLHQGIAFLHKLHVNVQKVEFARALRLTNGNIEPLSFTVPRIKSELFQDDLFPPTLVTWEPWQSGQQWLAGSSVSPRTHCMQPPGMEPLSLHTPPPSRERDSKPKPDLIKAHIPMDPKEKQDNLMKSMSARVTVNMKLEQDSMEGVDEAEWHN